MFGRLGLFGLLLALSVVRAAPAVAACPSTPDQGSEARPRIGRIQNPYDQAYAPPDQAAAVLVPYFFGLTREKAEALANDSCLTARFVGVEGSDAMVVAQSLSTNQRVRPHALIRLQVALVDSTTVPSLVGMDRAGASTRAVDSGLKPMFYGPTGVGASVATQSRLAGQVVPKGSYIQLQMAAAPSFAMPNFIDRTRASAEVLARANRLSAVFSGSQNPKARVVEQGPPRGVLVYAGASVTLQLGATTLAAPDLVGLTRAVAAARARKSGFVLDASGDMSPASHVSQQSPAPGQLLQPDAHIQVVLAADAGLGASGTGSSAIGDTRRTALDVTVVPDMVSMTRGDAERTLRSRRLLARVGGDRRGVRVGSQNPAAGSSVPIGSVVSLIMVAGSPWPWLAVVAAVVAVVALGVRRFIRRPAVVTYIAHPDPGRPTLRLASEPPAAARALTLERPEGDGS